MDGRPTLEDVAARAGVSRALVSIVFRGVPGASAETRSRVMRAADELGYRPDRHARLLSSARTRTLGVVFGLHRDFHADLLEAWYAAVDGTGYELVLGASARTHEEHRAVRSLLEFRCEEGPRTTVPESGSNLPSRVLSSGDLPHPLGPTRPTRSPR